MTHRRPRPDPRVVNGRYLCGYWRQEYTVLARSADLYSPWLRVRWADGHITEHQTAWDWRHDKILEQPT